MVIAYPGENLGGSASARSRPVRDVQCAVISRKFGTERFRDTDLLNLVAPPGKWVTCKSGLSSETVPEETEGISLCAPTLD